MASPSRRRLLLVALLLAGIAVGVLTVVPPQQSRAVITVSRLGDRVRLLPEGMSFSFLPLARRLVIPRTGGHAGIDVELEAALPGGATAVLPGRLLVSGEGVLPVAASRVRALGWEAAWRELLAGRVSLDADELEAVAASSEQWRRIFPAGSDAPPLPNLAPRLAAALAPLGLAGVEIGNEVDADLVRAAARRELERRTHAAGRLVVLGVDALDWTIVDELTGRGLMPSFDRLIRRGAQAVLEVPRPLISPVVWTTIATGVPPEVHGVLDFLEPDPAGGPPHPVSSASRTAPATWEMVAAAGRTTAVVGWWATFPAVAPAGGAVYSDRLTEQLLGLSARVPGLADPPQAEAAARELALRAEAVTPEMLAPYVAVSAAELSAVLARSDAWDDPVGGLAKLVAATLTVERLTDRELERGTEVVYSYLEGTDTVGHLFGPFRPPVLPGFDPALGARFGAVVDRYYSFVDRWVGRVVARLSPDDTVVLVSDHGFTWGDERPRVPAGAHTATAELWHRPEGVFIAVGPTVRASVARRRLGVLDVGPTLLALAGLPPAAEMPGAVPEWLLLSTGRREKEVRFDALVPPRRAVSVELPPEAREEELAKLRALGYLAGGEAPTAPDRTAGAADVRAPEIGLSATARPTPSFDRAEARRLNNLAISQASAGDRESAEKTFRDAIAADRTYASAYYSLSILLRNQNRLEESDQLFWMAVRLGVRERELAVVRFALDYRQRGDLAKAREALARGRELFPDSATIWLNSGVFLGEQGDYEAARGCLERAIQLEPDNPAGFRNLAVALLGLGDRDGARTALTRALELDPSNAPTRQQLESLSPPP